MKLVESAFMKMNIYFWQLAKHIPQKLRQCHKLFSHLLQNIQTLPQSFHACVSKTGGCISLKALGSLQYLII